MLDSTPVKIFTGATVARDAPVSQPFLETPLNLLTLPAVKVYRRFFPTVEITLHLAATVAPLVARQKRTGTTLLDEAKAAVARALEEERARLTARIAQWRRRLDQAGGTAAPLRYTHPEQGTAAFRSPQAGAYLGLIQLADEACQLIHQGFFQALIPSDQKLAEEHDLQRRLSRLAGTINGTIRHAVTRILRAAPGVASGVASAERTAETPPAEATLTDAASADTPALGLMEADTAAPPAPVSEDLPADVAAAAAHEAQESEDLPADVAAAAAHEAQESAGLLRAVQRTFKLTTSA